MPRGSASHVDAALRFARAAGLHLAVAIGAYGYHITRTEPAALATAISDVLAALFGGDADGYSLPTFEKTSTLPLSALLVALAAQVRDGRSELTRCGAAAHARLAAGVCHHLIKRVDQLERAWPLLGIEAAHLLDLAQLRKEVLKGEAGLEQLLLHLGLFFFIDELLGAIDESNHIAHAEDP